MDRRLNVLAIYRRMLKMGNMVRPIAKREETIQQIRTEFRASREVDNEQEVEKLLNKANSSLGFIKMITPRTRAKDEGQSGRTRLVFGAGGDKSRVGSKGSVVSNWTGSNMDPDSVKERSTGVLSRTRAAEDQLLQRC